MALKLPKLLESRLPSRVNRAAAEPTRAERRPRRRDGFELRGRDGTRIGTPQASIPTPIPVQRAMPERPAPAFETEKADRIVKDLYRSLLGREADPEGLEHHRALVEQGQLSRVVNGMALSQELAQRAPELTSEQLSSELYAKLLGREADPEGGEATVAAIRRGHLAERTFDMITSPEYAERLGKPAPPGPVDPTPGPGPTEPSRRTGLVRASGSSFADDQGEFNGLGATMMWATWAYKNDRPKLEKALETLSQNGFNYVRVLGTVGDYDRPDYWDGREIDWRDPQYKETIAGLTDLAYDKYGLRVEWTLIGDGQKNIPSESDRYKLVDTFLEMSRGREQKIMHFEIANEAWQNGFSGDDGAEQLRRLTKYMNDRTDILVASSAPDGYEQADVDKVYGGGVADLATIHFDRDISKVEGSWRPVRQPWEYQYYSGMPKLASNNEPIGPGASVNTEADPKKLVAGAITSYLSGVTSYVYHTNAGVRGDQDIASMPGVDGFRAMSKYVPPDLASWQRKNAHWHDSPFKVFAREANGNLVADKMWPDLNGGSGVVRSYGAVKGDEFFVFPFGIKDSVTMEPRRAVEFDIIDPMSGDVVGTRRLAAGERFELSGGEMFVLKGRYV